MGTKREIYCPPVRCIEALRVNGPSEKNAYAMKSAFKTAVKNYEQRQRALKALPPNRSQRRASSNTKAKHKTTSLQGEHSHKQSEKSRRPRRSNCDSSGTYAHYYDIINPRGKSQVYSQATQERPYQPTSGRSCGSAYLSLHHFTPPKEHFGPRLSRNLSY